MLKKIITMWLTLTAFVVTAQNPQTQNAPIFSANAKYVNGTAPGYWPTQSSQTKADGTPLPTATGLVLNIGPGSANCSGTIVSFNGGTLTMSASTTNYVYLDTTSSCNVSVKTSTFGSADIPIAKVITGSSAITSLFDDRTIFSVPATSGAVLPSSPAIVWALTPTTSRAATPSDIAGVEITAASCSTSGTVWSPSANSGAGGCVTSTVPTGTVPLPVIYQTSTTIGPVDPTQGNGVSVSPSLANAIPMPTQTFPTTSAGINGFINNGDSITYGVGSTGGTGTVPYNSTTWVSMLASQIGVTPVTLGGTWKNAGVAGAQAADIVKQVFNSDAPVAGDGIMRTLMGFINDALNKGAGAYQAVANSAMMAAITWEIIPSSQKVMGNQISLPSGWSLDTTYTQATGICTNGTTPAVFPFTTTTNNPEPTVFMWIRTYDLGGTTTGTFKYHQDSSTDTNTETFNAPAVATLALGATDTISSINLGQVVGAPGSHSVTVTPGSNGGLVCVLGIGYTGDADNGATAKQLWVGDVTRSTCDTKYADAWQYSQMQKRNIKYLQSIGMAPNFVMDRASWLSTGPTSELVACGDRHPNNTGQIAMYKAWAGPTAVPETTPLPPSGSFLDTITTAAVTGGTAVISPSADNIRFTSTASGNVFLPPVSQTIFPHTIYLTNEAGGIITLTAGAGQTGGAVGAQIPPNSVSTITSTFPGHWEYMPGDPFSSAHSCTSTTATTFTLTSATDCLLKTGSALLVVSIPASNQVGQPWTIINSGTTPITFANGGTGLTSQSIGPGGAASIITDTTTTAKVNGNSFVGAINNTSSIAVASYTLLATDTRLEMANGSNSAVVLPSTIPAGFTRMVIIANPTTHNVTFSGASSGTANSSTLYGGQVGLLISSASGGWYLGVLPSSISIPQTVTSNTSGTNVGSWTCTTATCTSTSGSYTATLTGAVSAGGTISTLLWPTTGAIYKCTVVENDTLATPLNLGHSVATATGMTVTSGAALATGSIGFDYKCEKP